MYRKSSPDVPLSIHSSLPDESLNRASVTVWVYQNPPESGISIHPSPKIDDRQGSLCHCQTRQTKNDQRTCYFRECHPGRCRTDFASVSTSSLCKSLSSFRCQTTSSGRP